MRNEKGFTLIELLVAASLLAVACVSLLTSFQSGLAAFRKSEDYLMGERDQEVFFMQLDQELKNAVPFTAYPFVGNSNRITFPAKIRRYTPQGMEEGLFLIEYQFKSGTLTRKETKLKKESVLERGGKPEVLFEGVPSFRFDFLAVVDHGAGWDAEWANKPYTGLPRGVRVQLQNKGAAEKSLHQILIPQGILNKRI